jgi:hypothetical protein
MLLQQLAARYLEEIPGGRFAKPHRLRPHGPGELATLRLKAPSNKRCVSPHIGRVGAVAGDSPEAAPFALQCATTLSFKRQW